MKKISVIIPVYNTEQYLGKCLDSVLRQSFQNLEVILVDDGSKQPARDLCDELSAKDPRIKVIHKQNGGLSSSRNTGLEKATGDYISFIDSDDYIAKDFYSAFLEVLNDDQEVACSHIVRVTEEGALNTISEL